MTLDRPLGPPIYLAPFLVYIVYKDNVRTSKSQLKAALPFSLLISRAFAPRPSSFRILARSKVPLKRPAGARPRFLCWKQVADLILKHHRTRTPASSLAIAASWILANDGSEKSSPSQIQPALLYNRVALSMMSSNVQISSTSPLLQTLNRSSMSSRGRQEKILRTTHSQRRLKAVVLLEQECPQRTLCHSRSGRWND